jgi:hypothetical protein
MTAAWTKADIKAGAEALLAANVMTGNDEFEPTAYTINAEKVEALVQTVVAAVAPAIAARAVEAAGGGA